MSARRFDVNHPGLATRAARAESAHRRARGETTQRTLGTIGGVVSEFFRWQREEARQDAREDADREREDREREWLRREEERRAEREASDRRAAQQRTDREARNRAGENPVADDAEERAESEPERRVGQPTIFSTPSQAEAPRKAQRVDP